MAGKRSSKFWAYSTYVVAALAFAAGIAVWWHDGFGLPGPVPSPVPTSLPPPPPAGPTELSGGCVIAAAEHDSTVNAVNDFFEVSLSADKCPPGLRDALRATPQKIGSRVRVELIPPPGFKDLVAVTPAERVVTPSMPAEWTWQLQPRQSGEFVFSIVVSVLDSRTSQVFFANPRLPVRVHVPAAPSPSPTAATGEKILDGGKAVWKGIVAVLGAAGLLAGIAKVWSEIRQNGRRTKGGQGRPKSTIRATTGTNRSRLRRRR